MKGARKKKEEKKIKMATFAFFFGTDFFHCIRHEILWRGSKMFLTFNDFFLFFFLRGWEQVTMIGVERCLFLFIGLQIATSAKELLGYLLGSLHFYIFYLFLHSS